MSSTGIANGYLKGGRNSHTSRDMSGSACLVAGNRIALEQAPDSRPLAVGAEASALWHAVKVSTFDSPEKKQEMLRAAVRMRLDERAGWLAVRSSEFPAGNLASAALASLAISTYHYELGELERGWEWLQTALAEAPPNTIAQACVKHSVRNVQG